MTSCLRVEKSTYTYGRRAPARETVNGIVDRVMSDEHTFVCLEWTASTPKKEVTRYIVAGNSENLFLTKADMEDKRPPAAFEWTLRAWKKKASAPKPEKKVASAPKPPGPAVSPPAPVERPPTFEAVKRQLIGCVGISGLATAEKRRLTEAIGAIRPTE
jgi:hypothetical protein